MRQWIVLIQEKSLREYPTFLVFEGTTEEGNDLERRIRSLYSYGYIKNWAFQPIRGSLGYEAIDQLVSGIEEKAQRKSRRK